MRTKKYPKILNTKIISTSKLFDIEQVDLRFYNGNEVAFERILGNEAIMVVAILGNDLLLIREYVVGQERYVLSFTKGRLEKDEDVLIAANRELQEEVGFKASKLSLLKTVCVAPGYTNFITHIVLAEELSPSVLAGDEPEDLEIVKQPLSQWAQLLQNNDFFEARSQLALFLTMKHISMESP